MSTLSVLTSSSGSSAATVSPTCLSQRVTVPSVTLSPSAGSSTLTPAPDVLPDVGAGLEAGAGSATAAGSGAAGSGAAVGVLTAGAAESSDASEITASSPPTSTTSSSLARISVRTPDTGEGISVSTLSVLTSSSGSSAATVSPTCLSQRVTVPSVTLSPSWGIVTGVAMLSPCDQACACRGLPARARCASPMASFWVGCAWTRAATSSG